MLPRLIALCGHPKSGKTTLADMLCADGYVILDDGAALREIAMDHMGLSTRDVLTQEGKAEMTHVAGQPMTKRQVLGRIGNALEREFGEHVVPWMASLRMTPGVRYVMPSVRKTQGHFWRAMGGMVLEVRSPLAGPSGNDFDLFDETCVDAVVHNTAAEALSLGKIQADHARLALYRAAIKAIEEAQGYGHAA